MSEPLIRLDGVGKQYPAAISAAGRLRTLWALLRHRRPGESFDALDGISFDVMPGQSLGLIGENGAGSLTLLKIIAGVVKPSQGSVTVNGRIGALLELGAGFHPEYSGRENIYLAAALMGMKRDEIKRRIDEIVVFAEISANTSISRSSITRREWSCAWDSPWRRRPVPMS